jgi:hypothetical protein
MPRMGPATAACKMVAVKSLPWNCTIFWMNPQEGIGCLSAPLRSVRYTLEATTVPLSLGKLLVLIGEFLEPCSSQNKCQYKHTNPTTKN